MNELFFLQNSTSFTYILSRNSWSVVNKRINLENIPMWTLSYIFMVKSSNLVEGVLGAWFGWPTYIFRNCDPQEPSSVVQQRVRMSHQFIKVKA